MAHINHSPSKHMLNLLHVVSPYAQSTSTVNCIIELNSHTLNKYELITESGQLKLDRVWYSSLSYPFAYGAIPMTRDLDNDPLDIEIVNVTEPLIPGSLVEARIIWVMKFDDWGETDDKIIAVLAADKRSDHITTIADLWEYFVIETTYYREHYKDLKKPGTCRVWWFFDTLTAQHIIDECAQRYTADYLPQFDG